MALVVSEDQQILTRTAADFVKKESPVSRIRTLRDSQDELGFSRDVWRKMAELGWQAILIPEAYGGLGMGYADMACVLEQCGRNLVPEPLLSTVLLGANAVVLAGSEAQKQELLPRVADGSLLLALAYQERASRYDVADVSLKAVARGDGFTLSGEKTMVLGGHSADKIIVSVRTSGGTGDRDGVSLFLVDRDCPGLTVTRQTLVDLRNSAVLRFDDVEVGEGDLIGAQGAAVAVLEQVIDRATLALCCEGLGSSLRAFEMTLEYLKTRKQFGVLIGTFQALKHRAAEMFVELELSRSAVMGACEALDRDSDDAAELISVAKAKCSETALRVGYEAVQMHGGIGMTDEHDIGFYAKRARAVELTFGDARYHRDRFATLQGF